MIKNYGFPASSRRIGNAELGRYKLKSANEFSEQLVAQLQMYFYRAEIISSLRYGDRLPGRISKS